VCLAALGALAARAGGASAVVGAGRVAFWGALAMGATDVSQLRDVGRVLANLKEPEPPKGLKDAGRLLQMVKSLWDMKPATLRSAPCQQVVLEGADIDLITMFAPLFRVERIFLDLQRLLKPDRLSVYARYVRRGGLDINPYRSTEAQAPLNGRLVRQ